MSKSLASLLGPEIMRQRAMSAVNHSNYAVLQNRYVEEQFSMKISELAGRTFVPLAGFTVTIGEAIPVSQNPDGCLDDVLSFGYVEYGTGYRLCVTLKVQVEENYLPLGVELKAFTDAVSVQLETILNTCGYTLNESPIMGLRSVNSVDDEVSELFSRLFTLDTIAKGILNTQLGKATPEFGETDSEYTFSAEVPAIPLNDGLLVHRSALGPMVELVGRKILQKSVSAGSIIELDYLENWEHALAFMPIGDISRLLKSYKVPIKIEDQRVYVRQVRDWQNTLVDDEVVLDKPQDWFYLTGQRKYTSVYSSMGVDSVTVINSIGHITSKMLAEINAQLPRLRSAPRLQDKVTPKKQRRSFRRWIADGIRSIATWFDK